MHSHSSSPSSTRNSATPPDHLNNPSCQVPSYPAPTLGNPPSAYESSLLNIFANVPRVFNNTCPNDPNSWGTNYYNQNFAHLASSSYTNPSYPVHPLGNPPSYFLPPTLTEAQLPAFPLGLPPAFLPHPDDEPISSSQSDSNSSSDEMESRKPEVIAALRDYKIYAESCKNKEVMSKAEFIKVYNFCHPNYVTSSSFERASTKTSIIKALKKKRAELNQQPIQNHEAIQELNEGIAEIGKNHSSHKDAGLRRGAIKILQRLTPPKQEIIDTKSAIEYFLEFKAQVFPGFNFRDLKYFLKENPNIPLSQKDWTNAIWRKPVSASNSQSQLPALDSDEEAQASDNAVHGTNVTGKAGERARLKAALIDALEKKKSKLNQQPGQNPEGIQELNTVIAEIKKNTVSNNDRVLRSAAIEILERLTPPELPIVNLNSAINHGLEFKKNVFSNYNIRDLNLFLKKYNIVVGANDWKNAMRRKSALVPSSDPAPESQPPAGPAKKRKHPEFSKE